MRVHDAQLRVYSLENSVITHRSILPKPSLRIAVESPNFSVTITRWIPGPAQRAGLYRPHNWGHSPSAGLRTPGPPRCQIRRPSLGAWATIPISRPRVATSAGVQQKTSRSTRPRQCRRTSALRSTKRSPPKSGDTIIRSASLSRSQSPRARLPNKIVRSTWIWCASRRFRALNFRTTLVFVSPQVRADSGLTRKSRLPAWAARR
jgi:hypothetical protein